MNELLRLELQREEDVLLVRQRGHLTAQLVGLGVQDQTRVATAASELARYAYLAGPGSVITFGLGSDPRQPRDQLRVSLSPPPGGFPADAGSSDAFVSAQRLMDGLRSRADGGIDLVKNLPGQAVAAGRGLAELRRELAEDTPTGVLSALQGQNAELAVTLLELRTHEAELLRLNEELAETNRGVLALYAELEARSETVRNAQRVVFEELEDALRPPVPPVPHAQLAVRYVPAQHNSPTGGDLYDWMLLADGSLHLCVVDVLGHGVTSTRDALLVTHTVRTLTLEGHRIGRVIERVDALLQSPRSSPVATVLLARVDLTTGVVQLAGGGHPPALVVPVEGPARYVEASGRPVGYPEAGSDEVTTVVLAPGDELLLYTDGLIEASRNILVGLDLLAELAASSARLPLERSLDAIVAEVQGRHELRDDTLLLGLRYLGG